MAFVNLTALNNLQATTTNGAGGLQNVLNVNVVAGGGGGTTNSILTTLYEAIGQFTDGANTVEIGDTLQNIQILDATGSITSSSWQDLTQGFPLANDPDPADIAIQSSNPLTNSQLRAAPVPFISTQLPITIGPKVPEDSLAVTSQQFPSGLGLQTPENSFSVVVSNPSSLDNFPVANVYTAIADSTDVVIGNVVQEIQAFNFATNPATLVSTVWENLTTQTVLAAAPPPESLTLTSGTGLTNAQLRATAVDVSSDQLPETIGLKSQNLSLSVAVANPTSAVTDTSVTTLYRALTTFVVDGATVTTNDTLINLEVFDVDGLIQTSVWFDQTTGVALTGAVSADNIALISGNLATAFFQVEGNSTLASISGKLPLTLGQTTSAESLSVVASSDGKGQTFGNPLNEAIVPTLSTVYSTRVNTYYQAIASFASGPDTVQISDLLQKIDVYTAAGAVSSTTWVDTTQNITLVGTPSAANVVLLGQPYATADNQIEIQNRLAPGQQTMAGSIPVVIASDQSSLPLSVSSALSFSTLYVVNTAFVDNVTTNVAVGDILEKTVTYNGSGVLVQTLWFDINQQVALVANPSPANVDLISPVGNKLMAQSASVSLASDSPGQTSANPSFSQTTNAPGLSYAVQYVAISSFTNGVVNVNIGDVIQQINSIDPQGDVGGIYWFDQTQGLMLASAPSIGTQIALPSAAASTVDVANPIVQTYYQVITAGTGTSVGDLLVLTTVYNVTPDPIVVTKALWYNLTTGGVLNTIPTPADIVAMDTPGQTTIAQAQTVVLPSDYTLHNTNDNAPTVAQYYVLTAGTGYALNDVLNRVSVMDFEVSPITESNVTWFNVTQQTILAAAPTAAHIAPLANRTVTVSSTNPAAIFSLQQTMTTGAVAMASNVMVNGVVITAASTNTGIVYVGPTGVTTTNGYALVAGQSISYAVTNTNAIFLRSTVAGDIVFATGN